MDTIHVPSIKSRYELKGKTSLTIERNIVNNLKHFCSKDGQTPLMKQNENLRR